MCCAIAWKLLAGCSLSRQNCFVPGRHQAIKIDTQISSGPLYLRNILVLSWQHQQESENYQLYTQCLYSLCKEFSIAFIHNSNAVQHHQKNEILKLTNCQASKLLHWGSSKSFLLQPKETSKILVGNGNYQNEPKNHIYVCLVIHLIPKCTSRWLEWPETP